MQKSNLTLYYGMATFVVALDPSIEESVMFIGSSRPKKLSSSIGLKCASLVLSAFFALNFTSRAQTLEPNFSDVLVMGSWNQPVGATFDANGRLYVWETVSYTHLTLPTSDLV